MRKHLILSAAAAAAALVVGGNALAEGLSYSYAEADVRFDHIKSGGSDSATGFGVNGSYGFTDMFFGTASWDTNKFSDFNTTVKNLSLGVGAHMPLNSMIDWVGVASYESIKVGSSESGWGLAAGVRGAASDKLQWNAGLKYSDIGDAGNGLGFNVGARYYFMPAFSAGVDLGYRKLDFIKETVVAINARYDFGG